MHTADGGTPPSLSVEETSFLVLESSGLMDRLQVWHTSRGPPSYSQGMEAVDAVLALSLCIAPVLLYLPGKPAHSSGALIFVAAIQGILPDHLASGNGTCSPTGLYRSAYFQRLLHENLASQQPESRC